MTRLFTPPGRIERHGTHPLFGRLTLTRGVSLLKVGGLYRQVIDPSDEEIVAADIAYIGGHVYAVSNTEAAALIAAGYGEWVTNPNARGYGAGKFGVGQFGRISGNDPYGSGDFGSGDFGEG